MKRVALINVDFKLNNGDVIPLEIDDAIASSGFSGYNALFGESAKDEVMLQKIISSLENRFQRIFFIKNQLPDYIWPRTQLHSPQFRYYNTIEDFVVATEEMSNRDFSSDLLIYAEHRNGKDSSRRAVELEPWLALHQINIPVLNASGLLDAAYDKFIFSKAMNTKLPTFLVEVEHKVENFIQTISSIDAAYVVLKPFDLCRGEGVVILQKEKLIEHVQPLLDYLQSKIELSYFLGEFSSEQLKKLKELAANMSKQKDGVMSFGPRANRCCFLMQPYVHTNSTVTYDEEQYDATGRVVLYLESEGESLTEIEVLDGYWKLPSHPLDSKNLHLARLSYVNEKNAAKLTPEQLQQVTQGIKKIRQEFNKLLQSNFSFYVANYKHASELEQSLLNHYYLENNFIFEKETNFLNLLRDFLPREIVFTILFKTLLAELVWHLNDLMIIRKKQLLHYNGFTQSQLLQYLAKNFTAKGLHASQYLLQAPETEYLIDQLVGLITLYAELKLNDKPSILHHIKQLLSNLVENINRHEKKFIDSINQIFQMYDMSSPPKEKYEGLLEYFPETSKKQSILNLKLHPHQKLAELYRQADSSREVMFHYAHQIKLYKLLKWENEKAYQSLLENHENLLKQFNVAGSACYKREEWKQASNHFKWLLSLHEITPSPKTNEATFCFNLGSCYWQQRQCSEALPWLEKAYQIKQELTCEAAALEKYEKRYLDCRQMILAQTDSTLSFAKSEHAELSFKKQSSTSADTALSEQLTELNLT